MEKKVVVIPDRIWESISHSRINNAFGISLTCPHCNQAGTFHSAGLQDVQYALGSKNTYGIRRCPNPSCYKLVFIILSEDYRIIKAFPSVTIPFDSTRIPARIIKAFQEAITCHSENCYIAAAIMIRKTLEEIAEEKGIKGKTLHERLKILAQTIVIPKDLVEAMNELRLLGNDAAHIEAKTFEEIGQAELDISIEFTKEILKATYQYEDLLTKLRSLKKPAP